MSDTTIVSTDNDPVPHSPLPSASDSGLSPCPMLNALAKAGHLPQTHITLSRMISALEKIGIAPDLAEFLFNSGLAAQRDSPNDDDDESFDLTDLRTHHLVEHDGSLSRGDAWTGDHVSFDPAKWASYLDWFGGRSMVDMRDMAGARLASINKSVDRAEEGGGECRLSIYEQTVSLGKSALIFEVLKDRSGRMSLASLRSVFGMYPNSNQADDVQIALSPPRLSVVSTNNTLPEREELPPGFQPSSPPLTLLSFLQKPLHDIVVETPSPKFLDMGQFFWNYVRATYNSYTGELPIIYKTLKAGRDRFRQK